MSKTRKELRAEGVELHGPIVPKWFKKKCDGCSVPRGFQWVLEADQGKAACVIHDWRYFCISLAYKPDSPMREQSRIYADYELKINRGLSMRWRWVGRMYGAIYFRGVRFGGKECLKDESELIDMAPTSMNEDILVELNMTMNDYPEFDEEWFCSIIVNWKSVQDEANDLAERIASSKPEEDSGIE